MNTLKQAVNGTNSEAEARQLLLQAGLEAMRHRAGQVPALTSQMPVDVWTPPIPVVEWLDDFPSMAEIMAYRDGLLNKVRYQTAFHIWFIYSGIIFKTKGPIQFLRPDNHELIEMSNFEAVSAWLAYKKAKIWTYEEKKR